ncbi:MAG: phosphotransferase [Legionella sp.]|nr:phosphotransferase [Legionella sp.]
MNNNDIATICTHFEFGKLLAPPERVYGGLLHKMWRFEVEKGVYAVKQLAASINLANKALIDNYNLTEKIASCFIQREIPGVCAIEPLFIINGRGYLIYPWVKAKPLHALSEAHALQISEILARMHHIHLNIPEILAPQFDSHSTNYVRELTKKSVDYQCSFSKLLEAQLDELLLANSAYQQAISVLKKHVVVSHGDLDQKNVLWDENDRPVLIDWESARQLNPVYEIVNASLDWSGITTEFNPDLFTKMLKAYKKAGGSIDQLSYEASFYGVLGNWINWLVYNIERSCTSDLSEQTIGTEQVMQVLPTISRINLLIKDLALHRTIFKFLE